MQELELNKESKQKAERYLCSRDKKLLWLLSKHKSVLIPTSFFVRPESLRSVAIVHTTNSRKENVLLKNSCCAAERTKRKKTVYVNVQDTERGITQQNNNE